MAFEGLETLTLHKMGESVEIKKGTRNFQLWSGIGLVKRISKGKEFDIVYVVFGVMSNKLRQVIVVNSKARRQELTLKCGQYAQFYGCCFHKKKQCTFKKKDGSEVTKDVSYWELYAYAINGWYLPKMFDVRANEVEIKEGREKDQTTPMNDKELNLFENQVKELLDKGLDHIDANGYDEEEK